MSIYYSSRKVIKQAIDIDENEDDDDKRRDSFGRKRIDVIEMFIRNTRGQGTEDLNQFQILETTSRYFLLKHY